MFTSAAAVREFALAGNATITLESQKTGAHFTYRMRQATDHRTGEPTSRWFVSVLSGPDNESSFSYIGLLDSGARQVNFLAPAGPVQFRQTAKTKIGPEAPSVRGFVFFWTAIAAGRMPADMIVRHEGKCGRCGRKLTVPESIDLGIGPECAGKLGVSAGPSRRKVPSLADVVGRRAA